MKESKLFSKSDIDRLGLRTAFLQVCFNYERMQGIGWTYTLLPYLQKIYKDDKVKLAEAMKDHMGFINTHPALVGFLSGLILSLEEKREDRNLISSLRIALFGPLAGIGDAMFWFTILPIVAGICASFASQGSILGPLIFFIIYMGIFALRIMWTRIGYNLGTQALESVKSLSSTVTKAATVLGLTVVGALIASYVHITVLSQIPITADHSVALQADFFDKIIPNILPLAYTFIMYYFLRKKKVSPTILILVTFIMAICCSFLGIL